jgi:hypothetical protein
MEAHDQEERPLGREKPVGLLVVAGRFVLEVERKPAVRILLELALPVGADRSLADN